MAVLDENGDAILERRFKPYGGLLSGTNAPWGFGWTGNTGSRNTPLLFAEQYNRARHYSTTTKQWTTVDPLWPSEAAYGYATSNPTSWTDSTGLNIWFDHRFSKEEKAHLNAIFKALQALLDSSSPFYQCLDGCTVGHAAFPPVTIDRYTFEDMINSPDDAKLKVGGPNIVIQYSYNCIPKTLCGFTSLDWMSNTWFVHICVTRQTGTNVPAIRKGCGPAHCILAHELLHAFGLKHRHNDALDDPFFECVRLIPGCEKYTARSSGEGGDFD